MKYIPVMLIYFASVFSCDAASVKSLQVNPTNTTVNVNNSALFQAIATMSNGMQTYVTATWGTSDSGVAAVTAGSQIKCAAPGTVVVSAIYKGKSAVASLTCNSVSPILQSIKVSPPTASQVVPQNLSFTATGSFTDSSSQDLTQQVTWASNNQLLKPLSTAGQFQCAAAGTASATASFETLTDRATVTCTAAPQPPQPGATDGPATLPTRIPASMMMYPVQPNAAVYTVTAGSASDLATKTKTAASNCGSAGAVVNIPLGTYAFSNSLVFNIPPTNCDATHWLQIQNAGLATLPPQGTRVGPANAASMPRLTFTDDSGAAVVQMLDYPNNPIQGVWLAGLEVTHSDPVTYANTYPLVQAGDGCSNRTDSGCVNGGLPTAVTAAQLDSRIVLDRMYIHGPTRTPAIGNINCVVFDASYLVIHDSTITNCVAPGYESHGIESYFTFGPVDFKSNTIEAASIGVMFGAVDSMNSAQIPGDLYVGQNYFHKFDEWLTSKYLPKNAIECKACQRLLFEGNKVVGTWDSALNYAAFNMEPRNAFCSATWEVVQDVTGRYNDFQNVTHLTQFLGSNASPQSAGGYCPNGKGSLPTKRVSFHDNVAENVMGRVLWLHVGNASACPATGAACQVSDIAFNHNSIVSNNTLGPMAQYTNYLNYLLNGVDGVAPDVTAANISIQNNIMPSGDYPIWDNGGVQFTAAWSIPFNAYWGSTWTYQNNAVVNMAGTAGFSCSGIPANNFNTLCAALTFPAVGFTNWNNGTNGDYTLTLASPFHNGASDGTDVGANIGQVNKCTAGVVAGTGLNSCP